MKKAFGEQNRRMFYGGLYGTRVAALVTGHAPEKTVICAGRAAHSGLLQLRLGLRHAMMIGRQNL
jgi:hypothetical protein